MAIPVGINGFGRIGKCTFLQLLESTDFSIKAINTSFALTSIEQYINNDSVHGSRNHKVHIIDENHIQVKGHVIQVLNSRVPGPTLPFRECGVRILFETTGAFLTTEKMAAFDVDYVVLSAPPKDIGTTPMFCYGVNENDYAGERIVSVASCTTNCIAPFLAAAQNIAGGIKEGNFLTVHAATASQSVTDTANDKNRTSRSIFNNMIPHSTGASKTVDVLIPGLKGKIKGTSLRVPVSNVSMVDVNLRFNEPIDKDAFFAELEKSKYNGEVIKIHQAKSVSGDFIGTYQSSVVDFHQTFQLTPESMKFCLWYDNEWSFTNNMILVARLMEKKNASKSITTLKDVEIKESSNVFLMCDFNHVLQSDKGMIENKVKSKVNAIVPTIKHIMNRSPSKLVIGSNVNKPFEDETKNTQLTDQGKFSLKTIAEIISQQLEAQGVSNCKVNFLDKGLLSDSQAFSENGGIYLCENLASSANQAGAASSPGSFKVDVFVNDCLSQAHQPLSFSGSDQVQAASVKCVGLKCEQDLVKVNQLLNSTETPPTFEGSGKLKVAVIGQGGDSPESKLPIVAKLVDSFDVVLVSHATANAMKLDARYSDLVSEAGSSSKRGKIVALTDGFGTNENGGNNDGACYFRDTTLGGEVAMKVLDLGPKSLNTIASYVDQADQVLWNGPLGKVEDEAYTSGSENLVFLLKRACGGDQVYVLGDQTCAFVSKYGNNFNMLSMGSEALGVYLSTGALESIPLNTSS